MAFLWQALPVDALQMAPAAGKKGKPAKNCGKKMAGEPESGARS
jgi:hypothetical protein